MQTIIVLTSPSVKPASSNQYETIVLTEVRSRGRKEKAAITEIHAKILDRKHQTHKEAPRRTWNLRTADQLCSVARLLGGQNTDNEQGYLQIARDAAE